MEMNFDKQQEIRAILKGNKYDALKYRHQDQSSLLHNLTNIDLRLFFSYLIAQFVIISFVVTNQKSFGIIERSGLFIIDLSLSLIILNLLERNFRRRLEAKDTIKNCNEVLGFIHNDIYIKGFSINSANPKFEPWFKGFGYKFGVIVGIIGAFLILFLPFFIHLISWGQIPLYLN